MSVYREDVKLKVDSQKGKIKSRIQRGNQSRRVTTGMAITNPNWESMQEYATQLPIDDEKHNMDTKFFISALFE